jgi:hypothetical protein
MTEVEAESSRYHETDILIERGDIDESFEVYMSLSNPASSSMDTAESESKDVEDDDSVVPAEPPLHPIFQWGKDEKWAVVYASVNEDAELARTPVIGPPAVENDEFLLHYVCKSNAPAPIVGCTLKANPEAISSHGCGGYLPLHYACEAGASIAVVELLLEAYPKSVKVQDTQNSRLPLHLAARREGSANAEVMALLMSYYPEAVISRDIYGKRPIDYAAKAKKTSKKDRWESVAVLEMGEKWIRVGQNVTLRLEEDFSARLRALGKDFGSYVESLKAVHDEEIAKIANDLLDVECDRELMVEALQVEKEETERWRTKQQANLDAISKKHDRFLILQEEARVQRLNLKAEAQGTEMLSIQEVEQKLAEETIDTTSTESATPENERKLMARIEVLEKAERLKAGVITKITAMAKMQEAESQKRIAGLTEVVDEQAGQLNDLLAALDLCEEQIQVLKERMEAPEIEQIHVLTEHVEEEEIDFSLSMDSADNEQGAMDSADNEQGAMGSTDNE